MLKFESLWILKFLWLIPFFILITFLVRRIHIKAIRSFWSEKTLALLSRNFSQNKFRLKVFLQALVLVFLILALARPQSGGTKQEIKSEGVELVLLLDVSESMMAEDVRPSRLEEMKGEMDKLVDMLGGNKVAIVAFAGTAATLSPLTSDPNSLKLYIDSLTTNAVSTQGTDFERALQEAESAFEKGGAEKDPTARVTRAIIMASDGEDHEEGALEEAKKLADKGIRIFTLAYGTEKGGPIPEKDNFGFLKGYKKDHSGQTILTTSNGVELEKIAQMGQGSFHHATFGGNHLNAIVSDLNKLQKTEFDSQLATQYDENFQVFVGIALALLAIELLLSDRKKKVSAHV